MQVYLVAIVGHVLQYGHASQHPRLLVFKCPVLGTAKDRKPDGLDDWTGRGCGCVLFG